MTLLLAINIKTLLILAVVTIIAVSCAKFMTHGNKSQPQLPPPYITVGVDDFQSLIDEGEVQILDVRSQEEYEDGHIAWAVLVDVNNTDFIEKAAAILDPAKPVAVYCRSGRRSARAASQLAARGFMVTNLDGGVIAWQDAGKALVK